MFSKACQYGIKAAILIGGQSLNDKRISLKDIAKAINSPEAFTAKILQQLARNGIVDSAKGPAGGFEIEKKKMERINLSLIVSAIDGDAVYKECGLGLNGCSEKKPCPMHYKFKTIREELKTMLESTSVYELSARLNDGSAYLRR